MGKCSRCGRYLSSKGAATCAHCRGVFHRQCEGVVLPEDVAVPKGWLCKVCHTKQSGDNSSQGDNKAAPSSAEAARPALSPAAPVLLGSPSPAAPAPSGTPAPVGAGAVLTIPPSPASVSRPLSPDVDPRELDWQQRLDKYMEEQRAFREEIRATLRSLTDRMNGVEGRLDAIERRVAEVEAAPCGPSEEVNELHQTVSRLQQELNERDQDALLADLEIGHIPEEKGENVVHTVTVVAAKLGVTLEPRDVVFAERVGAVERGGADAGGEGAGRPRRVVVRLARRQLRDELLRAARVRRTFTSTDAGLPGPPRRVYFNERLTRANRLLFYRVREECRSQQWKYSWTKRGRVYARQSDGKQAICMRSDADVERVFGRKAV